MFEMNGNTIAVLRLGLDAATLRHQVSAHNIANANTPGFAPVRVSFDAQMAAARDALNAGRSVQGAISAAQASWLTAEVSAQTGAGAVQLDQEAAAMMQNTLQYHALTKALTRHFQILSTAVSEGKR